MDPSFAALCRDAEAAGLACRGGFHPAADDAVPPLPDGAAAATLVLLGFVGNRQWPPFAASAEYADGRADPLDRWSRRVIDAIGARHEAAGLYPSDGPPWLPFQRWAMRAEPVHRSPLGLLIHPEFGLWHAYRGALAFHTRLELPRWQARLSPCDSCADKPCLTACPVSAVSSERFDERTCAAHVAAPAGTQCLRFGCLARRSCPVGAAFRYPAAQAQFHMTAFIRRR